MGMAAGLPGVKEDIFSLYQAVLASYHVSAEYDVSSEMPDFLAIAYLGGHQTRVFTLHWELQSSCGRSLIFTRRIPFSWPF